MIQHEVRKQLGPDASLELLVNGATLATATSPPWTFTWNTATYSNAQHSLQTRATDAAGNYAYGPWIQVTVDNGIGMATYDPELQVPRCSLRRDGCDTGTLLDGRAGRARRRGAAWSRRRSRCLPAAS